MSSNMQAVELAKAHRLLNHGPTVLVTARHGARRNVMAAAWSMPLDFNPPKIAVVIDRQTHTRTLIDASGCFGLNIPRAEMLSGVMRAGSLSGRELQSAGVDKFDACGLVAAVSPAPARDGNEPALFVEGCLAWLWCRVLPEVGLAERHDLFLAEVIEAWADAEAFTDGRWHMPDEASRRSVHHVAGGAFFATGNPLQAP